MKSTSSSAARQVVDPYVPGGWSSWDAAAAYVCAVYHDLFERRPDQSGLDHWGVAVMDGAPRGAIANSITSSPEFRSRLIAGAYHRFLGRGPDTGGLKSWLAAMTAGMTIEQIESGFIASDEYYRKSGSTPAAWVTKLYRDVLGRSASSEEVAGWVRFIGRGGSRSQVAMGFLLSTENLATVVDGYYHQLLGRGIDPSGKLTWVSRIQAGGRDEEIIAAITTSPEYWRGSAQVARIVLTPGTRTVRAGTPQSYRADGYDASGGYVGNVTYRLELYVDGRDEVCKGATCTVPEVGEHQVVGLASWGGGRATLHVVPRSLDHISLSPPTAEVAGGAAVHYAVEGFDASGADLGDFTAAATYRADDVDGVCAGAVCSPVTVGQRTVTATLVGTEAAATVTVAPPGPPGARLFTWTMGDYRTDDSEIRVIDDSTIAQLEADTHWSQVAVGSGFYVGLKTDGTLWAWGDNRSGQLGLGDLEARPYPTQVGSATDWASVSVDYLRVVALKADGSMWQWGDNVTSPMGVAASQGPWRDVSAGGGHTLAVRSDGTLWAWGWGNHGELGLGSPAPIYVSSPLQVGDASDWTHVSAAMWHSLGLRADGSIWSWGTSDWGALGLGSTKVAWSPTRVGAGSWTYAWTSAGASVGIDASGQLWSWGENSNGQLGDGTRVGRDVPVRVEAPGSAGWSTAMVLSSVGLGIRTDGTLWTWGMPGASIYADPSPEQLKPRRAGSGTRWVALTEALLLSR